MDKTPVQTRHLCRRLTSSLCWHQNTEYLHPSIDPSICLFIHSLGGRRGYSGAAHTYSAAYLSPWVHERRRKESCRREETDWRKALLYPGSSTGSLISPGSSSGQGPAWKSFESEVAHLAQEQPRSKLIRLADKGSSTLETPSDYGRDPRTF